MSPKYERWEDPLDDQLPTFEKMRKQRFSAKKDGEPEIIEPKQEKIKKIKPKYPKGRPLNDGLTKQELLDLSVDDPDALK